MAIHFENYRTFSRGQGFIGSACRPSSPQAKTARWHAVDCRECKNTLVGRVVVSRSMAVGEITSVTPFGVVIRGAGTTFEPAFAEFDEAWVPMPPVEELFGDKGAGE